QEQFALARSLVKSRLTIASKLENTDRYKLMDNDNDIKKAIEAPTPLYGGEMDEFVQQEISKGPELKGEDLEAKKLELEEEFIREKVRKEGFIEEQDLKKIFEETWKTVKDVKYP